MSIALGVALSAPPCLAAATLSLEVVVSFDLPGSSSDVDGPASDPFGPQNYTFVSVDVPETLVLTFTDNSAGDGPGADLAAYESSNHPAIVDVCVSQGDVTYTHLGTTRRAIEFDLADYPILGYVNYLKSMGLDDNRVYLDAAEVVRIRPDNRISIFGAILLTAIGTCLVGWLRRYRMR